MSQEQRNRVKNEILEQNTDGYNQRLTLYRKITGFLLNKLPHMAFSTSGWTCPPRYKPLLVVGPVAYLRECRLGVMRLHEGKSLRLHHIFGVPNRFILTYADSRPNHAPPPLYGLVLPQEINPLEGQANLKPGLFLGRILLTQHYEQGIELLDGSDRNATRLFLSGFNDGNKLFHSQAFVKIADQTLIFQNITTKAHLKYHQNR